MTFLSAYSFFFFPLALLTRKKLVKPLAGQIGTDGMPVEPFKRTLFCSRGFFVNLNYTGPAGTCGGIDFVIPKPSPLRLRKTKTKFTRFVFPPIRDKRIALCAPRRVGGTLFLSAASCRQPAITPRSANRTVHCRRRR